MFDGDGQPVPDAMIELWQADAEGRYHSVADVAALAAQHRSADPNWRGFGRMPTEEHGTCDFETIRPGRVPGPGGALQAPHLEVAIFARGLLKQLFTRIYFAADPSNGADPVLHLVPVVPEDRRETLMAHADSARPEHWQFDVRLQGPQETAFFDV